MKLQKHKTNGSVIITALVIVTLIVTLVTYMITRHHIAVRRTLQMLNADQSYLYALGVEQWAIGVLQHLPPQMQSKHDLIDWPRVLTPTPIPQGQVSGVLYSIQGRFNINNLLRNKTDDTRNSFINLLVTTNKSIDLNQANQIVDRIRKERRLLVNVSQLRAIPPITQSIYNNLLPYIFVLPETTALNINTADAYLLKGLSLKMPLPYAVNLVQQRQEQGGFKTLGEFTHSVQNGGYPINKVKVSLTGDYYLCQADVTLGQQKLRMYTLLKRSVDIKSGKVTITVLWQSRGTL